MSHVVTSESPASANHSPISTSSGCPASRVSSLSPEKVKPRTLPRNTHSPVTQSPRNCKPHPLSQPPINARQPATSLEYPYLAGSSMVESSTIHSRRLSFPVTLCWEPVMLSSPVIDEKPNMRDDVRSFSKAPQDVPWTCGDQAWRALLSQTVDVEWLGSVSVARFMAEVWKRGGPSLVSERALWSNVLIALAQPLHGGPGRAPPPQQMAELTLALQALYNVAIRPNEVSIISGFLTSLCAESTEGKLDNDKNQVYGAWTPTKGVAEVDLSQWTTLTPGLEWPSLSTTLSSGSGLTPRRSFSPALGLPPIQLLDGLEATSRPASRGDEDGIQAIDEILAQLEDDKVMRENDPSLLASSSDSDSQVKADSVSGSATSSRSESVTTPVDSVGRSASPFVSAMSHFSATSASSTVPIVSNSSEHCGQSPAGQEGVRNRQPPSMQLALPPVPFIPPPPMCMFFSPAFRDLQQGKVGVWKGDLTIRGRGGGTFNILIVGEQGSDDLWQSHLWGETLSYPPGPVVTESCTATMIPVSTLAREGLLPVTMGMVLCNGDNIDQYVSMVQGLHAEGVAFHLPGSTLPIVFLPAKFDSSDPLQRLGVAFMTKGGVPPPRSQSPSMADSENASEGRSKRKRRKSSSAKAQPDTSTISKVRPRRKSVPGRSKPLREMTST